MSALEKFRDSLAWLLEISSNEGAGPEPDEVRKEFQAALDEENEACAKVCFHVKGQNYCCYSALLEAGDTIRARGAFLDAFLKEELELARSRATEGMVSLEQHEDCCNAAYVQGLDFAIELLETTEHSVMMSSTEFRYKVLEKLQARRAEKSAS